MKSGQNRRALLQLNLYSQKDRDTIRTIKRKGITFSFLAYTYGTNRELNHPIPTVLLISMRTGFARGCGRRQKQLSDVVIVSAHWGDENVSALRSFKRSMQSCLRTSVDVVVDEHPCDSALQHGWMVRMEIRRWSFTQFGNFSNGMLM